MRQGPWHVFHFIGHGGLDSQAGEGHLLLAGDDGHSRPLTTSQLGRLLADHSSLRLAVLNACQAGQSTLADAFSSVAAGALLRADVPP